MDEFLYESLIFYTSDNGIPFPSGRTNFYDPGIREPLFMYVPNTDKKVVNNPVSLLDITPTILDYFGIKYPKYKIFKDKVQLRGKSLLNIVRNDNENKIQKYVYGSHNMHEITNYYPMRYVRNRRFKLIHNLNYLAPFPIDQDFYLSPVFQVRFF